MRLFFRIIDVIYDDALLLRHLGICLVNFKKYKNLTD
jgi:hypothetical protein